MSVRRSDPIVAQFLSPARFAGMSGLSLATVYRRLTDGSLPSVQLGGKSSRRLIPVDALDRLIQPTTPAAQPTAEPPPETPTQGPAAPELPGPAPRWRRKPPGRPELEI